jgi:hypothetical protein
MSETVNFESSGGKLPPAAYRLDNLDFDPTGNPYYKFPPFLSPPAGTPLIPFDKFKASGIQIAFETDVEELDGEGIPTIELGSKHGPGGDADRKKKRKRPKNGDDSRRGPWWEEWREGEDLRRADSYDPYVERMLANAYSFVNAIVAVTSPGPTDLLKADMIFCRIVIGPLYCSLYMIMYVYRSLHLACILVVHQFRHFAGLLGHATKSHRYGRGNGGGADEDVDDDDEEELAVEQEKQAGETNPLPKPLGTDYEEEPQIREIDADYQAELEAKEMKMDAFLNDPELAMKIFFSSFYKDKGLFWCVHPQ